MCTGSQRTERAREEPPKVRLTLKSSVALIFLSPGALHPFISLRVLQAPKYIFRSQEQRFFLSWSRQRETVFFLPAYKK